MGLPGYSVIQSEVNINTGWKVPTLNKNHLQDTCKNENLVMCVNKNNNKMTTVKDQRPSKNERS